jgi:glycosyltransferase involved in cell wall biosynthesis
MPVPLTVLVPAKNEEKMLPGALASVKWADEVYVIDSHSEDATSEIAARYGAKVAQFDYPGHGPKKKTWAIENLPLQNDWILVLDCDERVSVELRGAIERAIVEGGREGYYVNRDYWLMGRPIRCASPNYVLRLFRRGRGSYEDIGLHDLPQTGDNEIHESVTVDGDVGYLDGTLHHFHYQGLGSWLERHNRYSTWEAARYLAYRSQPIGFGPLQLLRMDHVARRRALWRIWVRLPCRPAIRFLIWYVVRGGFRDGLPGLVFAGLAISYELMISRKIRELQHPPLDALAKLDPELTAGAGRP